MIPAVALSETLTVQRFASAGQDAHGLGTGSWTVVGTPAARVEFSAADTLEDGRTLRVVRAVMFVAGAPDVQPTDRVVWQGRTFTVTGVLPRRFLGGITAFTRLELVEAT